MLRLWSVIVLGRLSAFVLRAFATLLALALLALLVWQYCDRAVDPSSSSGTTHRVSEATQQSCSIHGPATLTLLVRRLNFQDGVVTVDPTLCIPAAVSRSLEDNLPRRLVRLQPVVRETPQGPVIAHAFRDVTLLLAMSSDLRPALRSQEIPLRSIVRSWRRGSGYVRPLQELVIPVTGRPRDYPLEQYSLDLYAIVQLDPAVLYHRRGSRAHSSQLPLALRASVAPDLRTLRAYERHDSSQIWIRLTRPWPTELFVAAMLLIPLLLIAVLVRATGSRGARGGTEVVVGAAAVLLALLPIRAVLVPTNISTLTLVDYVLAFEVSLLAALVVWRETAA